MNQGVLFLPRVLDPLELPPAINMPTDTEKLVWIYGLSDPRGEGELHVIGRSVRPDHASALDGIDVARHGLPENPTDRQEWGIDLARAYRFAVTHLLAVVPVDWAEDYKRIYADTAQRMGFTLLGQYRAPDWRMDRTTYERILREARWVLTRAYSMRSVPDTWAPRYDAAVYARAARPPLTRSQWRQAQEDADNDRDYQAWLVSGAGPLARDLRESREDYDYRIGVMQARELGVPLAGEQSAAAALATGPGGGV